jgi:methionyl-tRNA formyltransferase
MTPNKYRVIFYGTPDFAVPALNSLIESERFEVVAVVTQPDKPVGRKAIPTPSPVKMVAIKHEIHIIQPWKIKKNFEFWEEVSLLHADINVVVAYGKILPEQILETAKHGSINIHGSKLPKYRGASPIHASILNGDKTTCFTIQKMVFAMDEGPIIAYGPELEIDTQDTFATLSQRMAESVAEVLPQTLVDYIEGKIEPVPQNDKDASYVALIKKEDGLIDWNQDEAEIDRKVRAYSSWPVAHTSLDGMAMQIISAEYVPGSDVPKGTVAEIDHELFIGKLKINKLQLAGRSSMAGRDFLRGYSKYIGQSVIQ